MNSVVLVTGGSGFIGSHVVDRLAAAGYRPRIFDTLPSRWHGDGEVETVIGDVLRMDDLRRGMRGCATVCHLAAAADVGEVLAAPAASTTINATGTLNVLEAARELGITRIVYASTVWLYSEVDADEVDEDTLLPQPTHLYTAGKLSGELYCRSYAELYGLEPTIVRFGIPYGPRARPAAVIPSFVDRARQGKPLTIAGSGEQERSFVYVEDLADGVVGALAPHAAGRTYNLAGRETTTIRGLAEIVRDEVADVAIVHTEGRAGDLRGTRINSDRAERELGWRARTPLRQGIRSYASWVQEHPVPDVPAPRRSSEAGAGVGRLGAAVRDVTQNPTFGGAVALIAVASAALSLILGSREETSAASLTVITLALLLPLCSLTVVMWPEEHRRLQGALALLFGAFGVLLLGAVSALSTDAGLHAVRLTFAVVLSAWLTSALWAVPRRLATSRT